jgi:hypothetical protein
MKGGNYPTRYGGAGKLRRRKHMARTETNIEKLLFFTGTVRTHKSQATEVALRFADKEIKVVLTYAEIGFLMKGLYAAAQLEMTPDLRNAGA